jgi:hypothetical protein
MPGLRRNFSKEKIMEYPMTHQGVRDLDNPIQKNRLSHRSHSGSRGSRVNVGPTERAFSTVGGAALAGFALGLGGFWEILLGAAAGTALAYRGLTGHCSAYAASGINTARRR